MSMLIDREKPFKWSAFPQHPRDFPSGSHKAGCIRTFPIRCYHCSSLFKCSLDAIVQLERDGGLPE